MLFGFGFGGFGVVQPVYQVLISCQSPSEPGYDSAMQISEATSTAVMVISASTTRFNQQLAAKLVRNCIWPLTGYVEFGSLTGTVFASAASSNGVRIAFMVALGLTITMDCFARFLTKHGSHQKYCT